LVPLLVVLCYLIGSLCSFPAGELLFLHAADILNSAKQLYALNMLILVLHEVNRNVLLVCTHSFSYLSFCDSQNRSINVKKVQIRAFQQGVCVSKYVFLQPVCRLCLSLLLCTVARDYLLSELIFFAVVSTSLSCIEDRMAKHLICCL